MVIAVFSNLSNEWCYKSHKYLPNKIIVEACGTDSIYRPDQRKTQRNMIIETCEHLKRLQGVKKFHSMRLHVVNSYGDQTGLNNSITDNIILTYNKGYLA